MVFWLAHFPNELSTRAKAAVEGAREQDGLAISDKTLWELAMMFRKDQIDVRPSVLAFLQAVEARFRILPVTSAIAARAVEFSPNFPRDPADRIIAATAIVHQMPLVTRDTRIHTSKEVECIW